MNSEQKSEENEHNWSTEKRVEKDENKGEVRKQETVRSCAKNRNELNKCMYP